MTPAERFAKDMAAALAKQPPPFEVGGNRAAIVSANGDLQLSTANVPRGSVAALIAWLTSNYVQGAK